MSPHAKFRANIRNNKWAMGDKLNSRWHQPQSSFKVLNLPFKFCVDRVYTFQDIAIWKFHKFGLKCLFRPPKSCFGGILIPKVYFLLSRPSKGTRFEPLLVVIGSTVWSGRDAKSTKKERTKSKPKFTIFGDPLSVVPHQLNFACRVVSRISFLVLSFRKIGRKCGSSGGSNFWLSHWLGTSLIQQLVAIAQAVMPSFINTKRACICACLIVVSMFQL